MTANDSYDQGDTLGDQEDRAAVPAAGTGGAAAVLPYRMPSALPSSPQRGPLRLGVIDVGSNTVHLLVVDAHRGGQPQPAASVKVVVRLTELLENGALSAVGEATLTACIGDMRRKADALTVSDLVAFATSALRDATNSGQVLARMRAATGVELSVLPGEDEARLTFLAVRRWFGWSAGRLLALDIGGGSLEIAAGMHENPDVVASLPLGASRLTKDWLSANDPPKRSEISGLRRYVRAQIAPVVANLYPVGEPTRAVATSKTFRSLARIAGAAPASRGLYVRRLLHRSALGEVTAEVCRMSSAERASLPGVSDERAPQLAAGAVVAAETMDLLGIDEVEICPWALREGVILHRLDWLTFG